MIQISDQDTGKFIGLVSEEDCQFLINELEEEGIDDKDYAITPLLLEFWETHGQQPEVVKLLRFALGEREGMNIIWERK